MKDLADQYTIEIPFEPPTQKETHLPMTTEKVLQLSSFNSDQLDLIKRTVAKGATDDELKLFIYRCQNLGLDPLKPGQIYFIKYGNSPGTIVIGIEGFRSKAARTGKLSGISRGVTRDEKGKCIGAWAKVHRSDWQHPAHEEVSLTEYTTGRGTWQAMPETMIKKVAECSALRMAFPDDLGGVYESAEMDQADARAHSVHPQQPEIEDGIPHDAGYRIPFGKFAKRAIEDIPIKDLSDYVLYLESSATKKNTPLTGVVKEFVDRAVAYLEELDRTPLDVPNFPPDETF